MKLFEITNNELNAWAYAIKTVAHKVVEELLTGIDEAEDVATDDRWECFATFGKDINSLNIDVTVEQSVGQKTDILSTEQYMDVKFKVQDSRFQELKTWFDEQTESDSIPWADETYCRECYIQIYRMPLPPRTALLDKAALVDDLVNSFVDNQFVISLPPSISGDPENTVKRMRPDLYE